MPTYSQDGSLNTEASPFIFVNPVQPSAGLLNTAGTLGAVGSGAAGLGSLAASRAASTLKGKLNSIDPYTPEALQRVNQFNQAMASKTSPTNKLLQYVQHGSSVMGSPAFRNGTTGYNVMETIYKNPVLNQLANKFTSKPSEFQWTPQKAQHYGEFAAGPARGYVQLARELYQDPTEILKPLKTDYSKQLQTNNQKTISKMLQRLDQNQANLANVADPVGAEALGLQQKGQRLQSRLEQLKNFDTNKAIDDRVGKLTRRYGDYHSAGIGYQLEQLAKADPELAKSLKGQNVFKLAPEKQTELLKKLTTGTQAGKAMANDFSKRWAEPINQYRMLGKTMIAPKQVLDAVGNRLGNLASSAKSIAKGSLPVFGASLGLQQLGSYLDRLRNGADNKALVEAIRSAGSQKTASTEDVLFMFTPSRFNSLSHLPLLGGFNAKTAAAYLLPPTDKVKKKKKGTPAEQLEELDKEAAFAEAAIFEQQAIMQQQIKSADFGGGWNPFQQF